METLNKNPEQTIKELELEIERLNRVIDINLEIKNKNLILIIGHKYNTMKKGIVLVLVESLAYMIAIEYINNNVVIHWLLFIMWILLMLLTINICYHYGRIRNN